MPKRYFGILAVLSVASLSLLSINAASASVPAPVNGSLTVTVPNSATPITLTQGTSSPAMTFTAYGNGLSGFGSGVSLPTRIQVRPSSLSSWADGGWTPKSTCPKGKQTQANPNPQPRTEDLTLCGISGVFINDVAVSNLQVYVEFDANSQSSLPNTLVITSTSGNTMFSSPDSVGIVRVELSSGAWELGGSASTSPGFSLSVQSNSSQQGTSYTTTRSLIFDANGGTGPQYSQTQTANAAVALKASTFNRASFIQTGWNTQADGQGTSVALGSVYTFAANATLYADWTAPTGTVTFDANGGTGTMAQQAAIGSGNLTSNALTRTGHTFGGWNTAANGSGTTYADGSSYTFNGAVTLYALWTANAGTSPTTAPATTAPATKLATTGASAEWLILATSLALIAGSGFLTFSRRKRIW